jgi:hypothetical protein
MTISFRDIFFFILDTVHPVTLYFRCAYEKTYALDHLGRPRLKTNKIKIYIRETHRAAYLPET